MFFSSVITNSERYSLEFLKLSQFSKTVWFAKTSLPEKIRAKKLGITNFKKKYNIEDMVKGDVIFCATGVTDGDLTDGVKDLGNEFEVTTFELHKSKKINKIIRNIYNK